MLLLLRTDPQFSMVVPLRSQARLWHSLLHWAYFGLFRAQRAAFVRPCANACAVFRVCGCPLGMSSTLQPFGPPGSHRARLTAARCSGAADALWACPRASSPSGLRVRTDPQFSMVVPLRSQARLWHSLLHWAYFGLFRAQRAAFVRPCANACAVFRVCGCPLGMSSTLQPFGPPGSHRAAFSGPKAPLCKGSCRR